MDVYRRDHSVVQARPGTTHGAYALHAQSPLDEHAAACDHRITLDLKSGVDVDRAGYDVLLCKRSSCVFARRRV